MLLETLLPLGKVDPGLRAPEMPLDLASIGRERAAARGDRLSRHGRRGDQGRSLHHHGARRRGDQRLKIAHVGRHRLPAQPDRDGDERLDLAEAVARPLHAGPRHAGQGAYRAPLRHALVAGRPVDPRVRARGARRLGLLAERRAKLDVQGPALQHQSHGAAVQSRPDRASATSRSISPRSIR